MKKVKIEEVEQKFLNLFEEGKTYDEIVRELNVSRSAISTYVKNHNLIHPSKRKTVNENVFNEFNEESVYWLGFLWADGYVQNTERNHTIDLEVTDLDHAEKFKKFIGAKNIKQRNRNNSITYRVNVSSKNIVERLYSLGFNIKDLRINIPNIPEEYLIVFLRGYFDGDGHIRVRNESIEGIDISGRIEFMEAIYKKFPYFVRKEFHSTHSERIYTNKQLGLKFLNDIYNNATIFLTRKYKCALSLRD